jgi:uncharacterized Zn-binding protein involved in type VI secretion
MPTPIALLGHMHVCPAVGPGPTPHVGGPVVDAGQSRVFFNNIPFAVVGGKCLCTGVGMMANHVMGSSIVHVDGKAVMRIGDMTGHGGKIVMGVPTILAD